MLGSKVSNSVSGHCPKKLDRFENEFALAKLSGQYLGKSIKIMAVLLLA